MLEQFLDSRSVVTREIYESCMYDLHRDPSDDWEYHFLGRKFYIVLHTYGSVNVWKVLSESEEKCVLEGNRLLTRDFDLVSADVS